MASTSAATYSKLRMEPSTPYFDPSSGPEAAYQPHRRPAEHPVVRAALQRDLAALRVDAQLEAQALAGACAIRC